MLERQRTEGLSVPIIDIDAPKVSRLRPKRSSDR